MPMVIRDLDLKADLQFVQLKCILLFLHYAQHDLIHKVFNHDLILRCNLSEIFPNVSKCCYDSSSLFTVKFYKQGRLFLPGMTSSNRLHTNNKQGKNTFSWEIHDPQVKVCILMRHDKMVDIFAANINPFHRVE